MALEPSLWGTLPEELLHLVFARLPVDGIGKLQVLSKEWKRNIDCKDSEFNHVLNATNHLNTFAVLPWQCYSKYGNTYDVQANRWHVFKTAAILDSMDGVDGGLVCFLSNWWWDNKKPILCYVMNPLTKQKRQLPPLLYLGAKKSNTHLKMVRMVKLIVDKKTKEYKVFVLSSTKNGDGGFFPQVYDSHIRKWTIVQATQGHIIGWDSFPFESKYPFYPRPCIYNFADGTLKHFNGTDIAQELEVEPTSCVLLEDHLFMLHKVVSLGLTNILEDGASVLSKYCISEFHLSKETTTWVKLRVHSCGPCKLSFRDTTHRYLKPKLLGCDGFLLVYGLDKEEDGSQSAWLYNLSTCEWRILPNFPEYQYYRMMYTISWSAIA